MQTTTTTTTETMVCVVCGAKARTHKWFFSFWILIDSWAPNRRFLPGNGQHNSMMFVDRDLFSHRKHEIENALLCKTNEHFRCERKTNSRLCILCVLNAQTLGAQQCLPLAQAFWISHTFGHPFRSFVRGHKFSLLMEHALYLRSFVVWQCDVFASTKQPTNRFDFSLIDAIKMQTHDSFGPCTRPRRAVPCQAVCVYTSERVRCAFVFIQQDFRLWVI